MKKEKIDNKEQIRLDKGQVFVKIMAGILAALMLFSVSASLIFALV